MAKTICCLVLPDTTVIGPFDLTQAHRPEQDLGISSYVWLCAPDLQARHGLRWNLVDDSLFNSQPVAMLKRSNNEVVPEIP